MELEMLPDELGEELEGEKECPNCGQETRGESACPNCGAILYNEGTESDLLLEDPDELEEL